MSDIKTMEEGFSELISNPAGIPGKKTSSPEIRKEHTRWKKKVQQIENEKSVKGQSYWSRISSATAL